MSIGVARAAWIATLALLGCDDGLMTAQRDVLDQLADPNSAKFSEVSRCGNADIVHGKVNWRDRHGEYVGDTLFAVDNARVAFNDGNPVFGEMQRQCLTALGVDWRALEARVARGAGQN